MAKYSYVSGMEDRGLDWLFVKIEPQYGTDIKPGRTTDASKAISGAFAAIFGGTNYEVVILENYMIPDGVGGYMACIYFYNENDIRRLPNDNIRFHEGAQDLGNKIGIEIGDEKNPIQIDSMSNDSVYMKVGQPARFIATSRPEVDNLVVGTIITIYNAAGNSFTTTVQDPPIVGSPSAGFTRINFAGLWRNDYSQAAGGYFIL
jgi:hypothetical protein